MNWAPFENIFFILALMLNLLSLYEIFSQIIALLLLQELFFLIKYSHDICFHFFLIFNRSWLIFPSTFAARFHIPSSSLLFPLRSNPRALPWPSSSSSSSCSCSRSSITSGVSSLSVCTVGEMSFPSHTAGCGGDREQLRLVPLGDEIIFVFKGK